RRHRLAGQHHHEDQRADGHHRQHRRGDRRLGARRLAGRRARHRGRGLDRRLDHRHHRCRHPHRHPQGAEHLRLMKIGQVEIPELCRLAPMAAISNAPFRLIARECGSGLTTTEEIDAFALLMDTPRAGEMTAYYPQERPLAMQLLGCDPEALARAAARCQELGADIVDLNMGCPMRKITSKGKGAALMRDMAGTARILRAMRRAISVPLTVKIRGGWDDLHLNAVEVARMAEAEGVDAITVHPRTRAQIFTGKAPWTIIAEVVEAVGIPVTGNGDVRAMAEARRMG